MYLELAARSPCGVPKSCFNLLWRSNVFGTRRESYIATNEIKFQSPLEI